ncbi:MAG TPA: TIGR02206 family membrane protein [Xanthobacteraceae bacterium]|nr:TIGR02206 family membrane protein [Xanthobacteraceae bacterium]
MNILPDTSWDVFAPYGWLHAVTVGICLLVMAGLVLVGRALAKTSETRLRRMLGLFGLVYWLSYNAWWNWHGIDFTGGLPLQICDINGVIAPLVLLTQHRWLRATLYYWAFALSTQAFIQPALQVGPANPIFYWFWGQHTIILAYASYDLAVLHFRPQWRDLVRCYAVGAIYLAVVVPLNAMLGADYGYLGNLPPQDIPPFVAALGPWPARAVILVLLCIAACAIVQLPWQIAGRRKPP